MKTIGIKLADGTFYPILEEGEAKSLTLDVTTVKDNQTKVQIDLYRSDTASMTDAEYVDTLEVTKLNPHPNGEPTLHLSVSLDENNELTAKVLDDETGARSETQVNLVSRTLAERENSEPDFTLAETAIDANELAALEAQEATANEPTVAAEEPASTDDFNLDDITLDLPPFDDSATTETTAAPEPQNAGGDFNLDDISLDLPDFGNTNSTATETSEPTETAAEPTNDFELEPSDLPDFSNLKAPAGETIEQTETIAEPADDFELETSDLPDFSSLESPADEADEPAETVAEPINDFELETTASKATDDPIADVSDVTEPDDSFDPVAVTETEIEPASANLPDFTNLEDDTDENGNTDLAETTEAETADNADTTEADDDSFSLPDFNDLEDDAATDDTATEETETEDFTSAAAEDAEEPTDDDDASEDEESEADDEDETDDTDDDLAMTADAAASSAMDFSDLYDKETMEGKHSTMYDDNEADETVKKTRVPVTICIICAIICIIATILVLFVIPSKYNWKNWSKHSRRNDEWIAPLRKAPLDLQPAEEDAKDDPDWTVPSPVAPEAEEDKIVVAPQPELVVPAPAPVPAEKPKTTGATGDIRYRIKWGDTLWDISEAYYKNPWRYPRIARYNNIKNPDFIISGTDILIPEE